MANQTTVNGRRPSSHAPPTITSSLAGVTEDLISLVELQWQLWLVDLREGRARFAVTLGLIPPFPIEKIHFIGNGAMDGALKALLNMGERREAEKIATGVRHIELSARPDFEATFLDCLSFGN